MLDKTIQVVYIGLYPVNGGPAAQTAHFDFLLSFETRLASSRLIQRRTPHRTTSGEPTHETDTSCQNNRRCFSDLRMRWSGASGFRNLIRSRRSSKTNVDRVCQNGIFRYKNHQSDDAQYLCGYQDRRRDA